MDNDRGLEPSFSIQSIISRASSSTSVGTLSTTTSLTESFVSRLSIEEVSTIKLHNHSNKQTIKSELTGEEVNIPWCGSDKRILDIYVGIKKDELGHGGTYSVTVCVLVNVSIVPLNLFQQEKDPAYKIKYPGGENEYNERFFQNCLTAENKPYLDKYEQEPNSKCRAVPANDNSLFIETFS